MEQGITEYSLVFNTDEATAGNVLQTGQRKKALLCYFALREVGVLYSVGAWIPWMCMPHHEVQNVHGGSTALFSLLAKTLADQLQAPVTIGGHRCIIRITQLLGDYEGLCKMFGAKGAAAVKPCMLCVNCINKSCGLDTQDEHFKTIARPIFKDFLQTDPDELHAWYDEVVQQAPATKKIRAEQELQLGFQIQRDGLLASPQARQAFNLGNVVIDATHCYWANGVASQEILLARAALEDKTGISLLQLQQSVEEVAWKCSNDKLSSPSSKKWLFHESLWRGDFYKGSATQVFYIIPLAALYIEKLAGGQLEAERASLRALLKAAGLFLLFLCQCPNEFGWFLNISLAHPRSLFCESHSSGLA